MNQPLIEDGAASSPARSCQPVHDLPDLTDKLKEHGLHEAYLSFRDGYMRWRKGEAAGAKGELDVVKTRGEQFEHWYPTVGTFTFRRTISFWSGALCVEGCLFFLWGEAFDEYGKDYADLLYYLTKVPMLMGGLIFAAGVYMGYYELINMNSSADTDTRNIIWCDWRALLAREIEIWSIIGQSTYLIGVLLYSFAQVWDLFELDAARREQLIEWPFLLGGFLFFIGGVCEVMINRAYKRLPITYVWWISVLDCIGGACFWLQVCPSVFAGFSAFLVSVVGTLLYLIGGVLSLCMWRGEQFGSALIPALNAVSRLQCPNIVVKKDLKTGICHIIATSEASPPSTGDKDTSLGDVLSPRLTWRGVLFLCMYILIGVIQMVVACTCLSHVSYLWGWNPKFRQVLSTFVSDVCNYIMVHMILLLNSACVSLPKRTEQPYRSLFIMMRLLSIILVANSVMALEVIFELDAKPVIG